MHLLAPFDVALIQARRASECISIRFVMHLLAPRACIENALHFEIPGEIQRELMNLIITAQHQNAQASAFYGAMMHSHASRAFMQSLGSSARCPEEPQAKVPVAGCCLTHHGRRIHKVVSQIAGDGFVGDFSSTHCLLYTSPSPRD